MKQLFESFWTILIAALGLIVGSALLTYWLSNVPPWSYISGPIPGEMAFIGSDSRKQIERTANDLSTLDLGEELNLRVGEIPMQLYSLGKEILEADREYMIESAAPRGNFYWSYLADPKIALTIIGMLGSAIAFVSGLYFSAKKKSRDDARHALEIEKLRLEVESLKRD
ncbi:hypothetical protein [Palleronia caenipelagi]|uniref:Uncharacterized protein n=1 Tax=Palleronia caenipelagi TaxID=2489174 RepID=A0A547Q995_9RHOB|nr:hypothetical protein [Palleronia caenipelagi]TRD22956.1 hypothetical protein FEV53_01975 [Palleronia caenipelagi]